MTMATGKTYIETNPPTLSCSNGKFTASRVWDVETTSPYVALLTIQIDADVPIGRLYEEGCDGDWELYATSTGGVVYPPLRAHGYSTQKMGAGWTRVTVTYEDERSVVCFDELATGYKAHGITSGMESISVEETLGPYYKWDNTESPNCIGYTVPMGTGAYVNRKDRTIGRPSDDEDGSPISIQSPTAIYWERWLFAEDKTCVDTDSIYGSSPVCSYDSLNLGNGYCPGWREIITSDPADSARLPTEIKRRLGVNPIGGEIPDTPFELFASAHVGTVNQLEFRGFQRGSLLMQPIDTQQLGENAWLVTFSWAISPLWRHDQGTDGLTFYDFAVPTFMPSTPYDPECDLEKRGWDAAWFQRSVVETTSGGTPRSVLAAMCVGQVYDFVDFNQFLPHRLRLNLDTDTIEDLDA